MEITKTIISLFIKCLIIIIGLLFYDVFNGKSLSNNSKKDYIKDILKDLKKLGYAKIQKVGKDNFNYLSIYNGDNCYIKITKIIPYTEIQSSSLIANTKKMMNKLHFHQGIIIVQKITVSIKKILKYADENGIIIIDVDTLIQNVKSKKENEIINNYDEEDDENPIKSVEKNIFNKFKGPTKL